MAKRLCGSFVLTRIGAQISNKTGTILSYPIRGHRVLLVEALNKFRKY